jgi:predicted O-methyltransferase YrrM
MSDLVEAAEWLFKHTDEARHIGQAAKALAESMSYEAEMVVTAQTLSEALSGARALKYTPVAANVMQKLHGADIYQSYFPGFAEDLQGWNSQHPMMAEIVTRERPQVIFDVGVWKGGSTLFLAELLRKAEIDGVVISVDTFLGSPEHWIPGTTLNRLMPRGNGQPLLYRQFLSNVVHRGMQGYVVPLPQTSINAAIILRRLEIQADMIHIDAAHEYEAVLQDARAYWPLLRPGGYLVGDDYHESWPGVVRGADEFAKEVGVKLEIQPPKWFVRKPTG